MEQVSCNLTRPTSSSSRKPATSSALSTASTRVPFFILGLVAASVAPQSTNVFFFSFSKLTTFSKPRRERRFPWPPAQVPFGWTKGRLSSGPDPPPRASQVCEPIVFQLYPSQRFRKTAAEEPDRDPLRFAIKLYCYGSTSVAM